MRKNMKVIVSILMTLILLINLVNVSMAKSNKKNKSDITVLIGNSVDNLITFNFSRDEFPFISSGRVMVPLRVVSTTYDATIDWDGDSKQSTVQARGITLIMTIGDKKVLKIENGEEDIINITEGPILQNGRIFVPLRLFSESFGSDVDWDPSKYIVTIIDSNINLGLVPAPITYGGIIVVNSADVDIKVIFKSSDAGYNNVFGIASPIKKDLGTGHGTPNGTEFNLGKFPVGTELKFFLRNPLNYTFLNGPSSRNADNIVHAKFQNLTENNWYLGFEDTYGGGDGDCNDVELNIIGIVNSIPVPEVEPTPIPTIAPTPAPVIPYMILKMREQIKNGTWVDVN